jgi:hypothetical protein
MYRIGDVMQKMLDNTREDLVESILNQLALGSESNQSVTIAMLRFLISFYTVLSSSAFMNETLVDHLIILINANSEYNIHTRQIDEKEISVHSLAVRTFATGLLAAACEDKDAAEYILSKVVTTSLLYRLKYYIQRKPRRPKFESECFKPTHNTEEQSDSMMDDEERAYDPAYGNANDLTEEQLQYREFRFVLQYFMNVGTYVDVLGPLLQDNPIEIINSLLQFKDKFIIADALCVCSMLTVHPKFAELFVDKGGLKQIMKLPKIPFFLHGMWL